MDQCETQTPILVDFKITNNETANKVYFSMKLNVQEEVNGPLEMILEANRCDLKKKHCGHYQDLKITQICQKFKDPFSVFSKAFAGIEPKIACPIKVANYIMTESSLDLSMITGLPIDGHVWLVRIKWMSGNKNVLCLDNETKITKIKTEKDT